MSAKAASLENVLVRKESFRLNLDGMNTDVLKPAARFWFGKAANKFRKDDCVTALTGVFHDHKRLEDGLRSLPEKERKILAIFKRYGGAVSGPLLLTELLTRGLVSQPTQRDQYYGWRRKDDPVESLCARLLLVSPSGGYSRYGFSYSYYRLQYPDLSAPPEVLPLVESAPPLPWKPSSPAPPPTATPRRSAAEVALDLWTTAQALAQAETWKTNRGGSLAKSVKNRLHKLFPRTDEDPLLPPDLESLYYELLGGLGAVTVEDDQGHIDLAAVERNLRNPSAVQGWHWVRAWMQARLWQDGIGVVPDRDSDVNPVRIRPGALRAARELVVWALCRVAHGTGDWLDLEAFLAELWAATGEHGIDFYWHGYSWNPEFRLARAKEGIPAGTERLRAYWLDDEGTWAANAVMGTLAHLGLVERGSRGSGRDRRFCFRLTGLGKDVFGAPERAAAEPELDPKFLTVQPNHEVLAYLDVADAAAVWPLAQMARRVSPAGGLVQTFALTRESVYQALESGLKLEAIRQFLREHSKTGLPDNVAQSLAEWGRRREALTVRTDVALGAYPAGHNSPFHASPRPRPVGEGFVLLPRTAPRTLTGCVVRDHRAFPHPAWRVNEDFGVSVLAGADSVALARLGQFADPDGKGWKITAASVRRARERGIPTAQVLGWLHDHLAGALPPIVETAVRNWSSPGSVFVGDLLMLQVPQAQACAMILSSPRFQPFLLGHVPPNWFILRPEKRAELEGLLADLGFAVGASYQLAAPPEGDTPEAAPRRPRSRRQPR
jgi:hypothetical protein